MREPRSKRRGPELPLSGLIKWNNRWEVVSDTSDATVVLLMISFIFGVSQVCAQNV